MYSILNKLEKIENLLSQPTTTNTNRKYRGKIWDDSVNAWRWDGLYDDYEDFPEISDELLPLIRILLLTIKASKFWSEIPLKDFQPFYTKMQTDANFDLFADENIPALLLFCAEHLKYNSDDYEFEKRVRTADEDPGEDEKFRKKMGLA